MDEQSLEPLLLIPDKRKTDSKSKKFHKNRAANALFCGLVLGFVFSFLVAYSGVIEDSTYTKIDYSINDFIDRENSTTVEVPHDTNIAEFLSERVRVLCFMVPMSRQAFNERGDIFLNVWPKRCTKFIFFADDADDRFINNTVVLTDKRNNWSRLREALTYIYKHHLSEFDWLLKTNDNTYVVIENLRWLLYQYESDWPLIIGQRFLEEDYMIGAYALSQRAFTRLIEKAFTNKDICSDGAYDEDKEISKCLQHVNVLQIDALDDEGKGMFFRSSPEAILFPEKKDKNYDKWFWHKLTQGPNNCCSDRLVAIQNVMNSHLFYMEYFIYKVHAFGRHRLAEPLPQKKTLEEIVKEKF